MLSLFSLLIWAAAILLTIKGLGLAWRSPLWTYLLFSLCKHTMLLGAFMTSPEAYTEAFWLLRIPEYIFKALLAAQLCIGLVDERFRLALRGWLVLTIIGVALFVGWPQSEAVCIEFGQFSLLLCVLYLIVSMVALGRSTPLCWSFLVGLGMELGTGWLHAQYGWEIATIPAQLAGLLLLILWVWQLHQEEKARWGESDEKQAPGLPVIPQKDRDIRKHSCADAYTKGEAG